MRPHAISMWAFARYASVPIRTGPTRVGGCVPARFSADKSHTVVRSIRNSIRALARGGCARVKIGILVVGACIRGTPSVRFADSSLGEDSLSPLRGQLPRGGLPQSASRTAPSGREPFGNRAFGKRFRMPKQFTRRFPPCEEPCRRRWLHRHSEHPHYNFSIYILSHRRAFYKGIFGTFHDSRMK